MFRVLFWEKQHHVSKKVGSRQTNKIPILDPHELSAGKITALFARHASRDLFDTNDLLSEIDLNHEKLRLACILYGAMSSKDWRNTKVDLISFEETELQKQLFPVLQWSYLKNISDKHLWCKKLVHKCRTELKEIINFKSNELEFFDRLYEQGKVSPELLTKDTVLQEKISIHPLLKWKAILSKR